MDRLPLVVEKGITRNSLRVWCDEALLGELAQLPGVSQVFTKKAWGAYTVLVDPRYEEETVKRILVAWASLEGAGWEGQRM